MLYRGEVIPFLVVISVPLSPSPRPAPTRPASAPSLLTSHALPLTRSRQLQCREVWGQPQGHSLWQRAADAVAKSARLHPLANRHAARKRPRKTRGCGGVGGGHPHRQRVVTSPSSSTLQTISACWAELRDGYLPRAVVSSLASSPAL